VSRRRPLSTERSGKTERVLRLITHRTVNS
jgi:hypothetical protein